MSKDNIELKKYFILPWGFLTSIAAIMVVLIPVLAFLINIGWYLVSVIFCFSGFAPIFLYSNHTMNFRCVKMVNGRKYLHDRLFFGLPALATAGQTAL
jgi:hypothetical protein